MKDVWRQAVHALVIVALLASSVPSTVQAAEYVEFVMEVFPNPTEIDDVDGEYIAITNNASSALDLTNWEFVRGDNRANFTFPITIAPGATAYICANTNPLENGGLNCVADLGGLNLINNASSIELYSPLGVMLVVVGWDALPTDLSEVYVASYDGLTAEYEIELNPLESSTYYEGQNVSFSGNATTPEGDTQKANVTIFEGQDCEGDVAFSQEVALEVMEGTRHTFSVGILAGSTGSYSLGAGLVDDGEEATFLDTVACQNFDVVEDVRPEGYLTIEKQTEGFEGGWTFNFTGDAGAFVLSNIAGNEGEVRQRDLTVPAGEVEITETEADNWQMTDVTCEYQFAETRMAEEEIAPETPLVSFDEESQTFVVDVPEEESVYCVVTNTYTPPPQGELIIEKVVTGFEGEWTFDFAGSVGNFSLTNSEAVERKVPWMEYFAVPAGVVTIDEEAGRNWQMTSVSCEYENIYAKIFIDEETNEEMVVENPLVSFDPRNGSFVVNVPDDTSVRCVITNTYNPRIGGSTGTRVPRRASSALPSALVAPVVALTTAVPTCEPLLTSYLHIGWDNNVEQVKKLQAFLTDYGFPVPITGHFGPLTEAAVRAFQAKYLNDVLTPWGISEATGFVFKTTRHKINNLVCAGSEEMPVL